MLKEAISKLLVRKYPELSQELWGLPFPTPIGTAPGRDPNGERYNKFPLQYSFVEIGPLSPDNKATLKNIPFLRMVFHPDAAIPSKGVKNAIVNIRDNAPRPIIAANIIPDKVHITTESVAKDMLTAFTYLYDFADMFVIDMFRKNADNVTIFQDVDTLKETIDPLLEMRICYETSKPVLFRLTSSISSTDLEDIIHYVLMSGIDGIIAGYDKYDPDFFKKVKDLTSGRLPIIACGGIDNAEKASEMLSLGASLIQTERNIKQILKHIQG